MTQYKTRAQATEFLRGYGVPTGNSTLAVYATEGRGPKYAMINGRALYTEQDLLAWLQEQANQSPQVSQRGRNNRAGVAA